MELEVHLGIFKLRGVCVLFQVHQKAIGRFGVEGNVIWFTILVDSYDCWVENEMTDGIRVQAWSQEKHLMDCCSKQMRNGGGLDQ